MAKLKEKTKTSEGKAKTKVKSRGRTAPIIDRFGEDGNPVPMNRYQSTVTKANNVGPFTKRLDALILRAYIVTDGE